MRSSSEKDNLMSFFFASVEQIQRSHVFVTVAYIWNGVLNDLAVRPGSRLQRNCLPGSRMKKGRVAVEFVGP